MNWLNPKLYENTKRSHLDISDTNLNNNDLRLPPQRQFYNQRSTAKKLVIKHTGSNWVSPFHRPKLNELKGQIDIPIYRQNFYSLSNTPQPRKMFKLKNQIKPKEKHLKYFDTISEIKTNKHYQSKNYNPIVEKVLRRVIPNIVSLYTSK